MIPIGYVRQGIPMGCPIILWTKDYNGFSGEIEIEK